MQNFHARLEKRLKEEKTQTHSLIQSDLKKKKKKKQRKAETEREFKETETIMGRDSTTDRKKMTMERKYAYRRTNLIKTCFTAYISDLASSCVCTETEGPKSLQNTLHHKIGAITRIECFCFFFCFFV